MRSKLVLLAWLVAPVLAATGHPFVFSEPAGQQVSLAQLSASSPSGLVCCTLWCSRCGSCRGVEPQLIKLRDEMAGKVCVVAVDRSANDDATSIGEYLATHRVDLRVLRDPVGGLADILKINVTTTTVIFDRAQSIRYFGNFGGARPALQQLLAGEKVTVDVTPMQGCPILR